MKLRFAAQADVPALLDIYAHYIPTTVSFEYALPSHEEFSRRVAEMGAFYPYLVAEDDDRIVGYTYAHRIAQRAAYAWGAELSVYLHPDRTGRGLGKKLYTALIDLLRLQGVRTVYGLVASPNPASTGLHRSMGFSLMGVQERAGYKNGRWIDLNWFQRPIAEYDLSPAPVSPIGEVDRAQVQAVLDDLA